MSTVKIQPAALSAYYEAKSSVAVPEGSPITLNAAKEKYSVSATTIKHWADRGWVKTIKPSESQGQMRIVDERDVAILVSVFKRFGKWQIASIMQIARITEAAISPSLAAA